MPLTITQLRLLALSKRRYFTDAVAWFMIYLLLALILPILLWHQFEVDKISKDNEFNYFVPYVLDDRVKFEDPKELTIEPLEDIPATLHCKSLSDFDKGHDLVWPMAHPGRLYQPACFEGLYTRLQTAPEMEKPAVPHQPARSLCLFCCFDVLCR